LATPQTTSSVRILVPGNHLMVGLLGQRDELLRLVEAAFPVQILVRGNEITVTGDEAEAERVGRLFEELVVLLEQGHQLDRENLGRSIEMLKADQRPTDVLTTEVVRGRKSIRPKTAGQKEYVDAVRDHTVTFVVGPAGTGKSYLAVALAVQALQAKEVNRIILTRPAVEAGERLGFLPGDMLQKVDPYLRPLYDALYDMLEPEVVARLMDRGTIEVAPLAYMRGRTLNDSFIILDEAQNTTPEQMKMFLTRLGFGSKAVVTGDVTQIDLPEGRGRSGLRQVRDVLDGIDGLVFVALGSRDVVRHRIVQDIVDAYERHEEDGARETSRPSRRR
jgi:phosphate starvation-inducible PhoH-like protein